MSGFGRVVALAPGEGTPFRIGHDEVTLKVDSVNADDGFSFIEYAGTAQPGPPPHVHRTFEECWFILEGQVDFTVNGTMTRGRVGSFLLVPRGATHSFQVVGPAPARWIGVFSPGKYVHLLEELGELVPADGPPDGARVAALFARYDTEMAPDAP